MEKKGEPSWVRLRPSLKKRVSDLSSSFGGTSESEIINYLLRLGLATYDLHMTYFTMLPSGIDFTSNGKESQED